MIMKTTINTSYEAVNNTEYSTESAKTLNTYAENYKTQAFEIINNSNTTFSEFIDNSAMEWRLLRILSFNKNSNKQKAQLLLEQVKYLKNQKPVKKEVVNNVNFGMGAPKGMTVKLAWLQVA